MRLVVLLGIRSVVLRLLFDNLILLLGLLIALISLRSVFIIIRLCDLNGLLVVEVAASVGRLMLLIRLGLVGVLTTKIFKFRRYYLDCY